jgi:hypothetical protein
VRALFGCLAVLLGAVSIALTARYGYKGADTVVDGVISVVVFGAIALCACLFDAAAVRLWFMQHRAWSIVIGSGRDLHEQLGRHRCSIGLYPGRASQQEGRGGNRPRGASSGSWPSGLRWQP